jgi:hypothetical protein
MEVRKEREEARQFEKELQHSSSRSEQLKEHYEQKLREVVK